MWTGISVLLFVLPLVVNSDPADNNNNNVQMTRTSIKVARNLDPDAMETLEVKTRTGDVATIVVKKRDGRQHLSAGGPNEAAADMQLVSSSSSSSSIESGESPAAAVARVPEPVVVRSDSVYVKNQHKDEDKKPRSLMHVDADGIPVITGVVEPDDENDTQVWRNARVINGVLVPNDKTAEQKPQHPQQQNTVVRQPTFKPSPQHQQHQHQQQLHKQQQQEQQQQQQPMFNGVWQVYRRRPETETPATKPAVHADDGPHRFAGPHRDAYDEQYMTDKILGYIRDINGNVLQSSGGDRVARSFAPQQQQQPRMEARVLHAPSVSVFPDSAAYSSKSAPSRLSFEESARTPVLQYAHPELGVQAAAKYEPAAPAAQAPVVPVQLLQEDAQRDGRRQQALSYFGHDIHADRSPFAFEPGLEKESRVKVPKKYAPPHQQQQQQQQHHHHYATAGGYPDKQSGKYGPGGPYYVNDDEASFWTLVKNKMRTSLDKVTDLTRPVVDPLVEATHKITGNLGFGGGNRELSNVVKEKLGMVATPSVLLPALGLVAGGAALGLGAVAVGRYLDYDVIRMRNNEDIIEFQRALNGSYEPIMIQTNQQENKKSENENEKQTEPIKRSRRSINYNKRPYANRKIRKVRLTFKT